MILLHLNLAMRKRVFRRFQRVKLELAYSATEASMRLKILVTETRDITLSRQRTTNVLIRLCRCTGWSATFLFAYDIKHVFSWPCLFVFQSFYIEKTKFLDDHFLFNIVNFVCLLNLLAQAVWPPSVSNKIPWLFPDQILFVADQNTEFLQPFAANKW